jgi:hypothetical protein
MTYRESIVVPISPSMADGVKDRFGVHVLPHGSARQRLWCGR